MESLEEETGSLTKVGNKNMMVTSWTMEPVQEVTLKLHPQVYAESLVINVSQFE